MNKRIYLDYAAATPLDKVVAKAMHEAEQFFGNPSSPYASGRESKELLSTARKSIAMHIGANAQEVVFTSGATESNTMAILGGARAVGQGHVISIGTEHASVRESILQLEREGFTVDWCPVDKYGRVDQKAFAELLRDDTILVSIAYASSEIGTIQSLRKVSQIVRKHETITGKKILFHTDASAAVSTLNCDASSLGVDLMTISSAKIYGPKGIGLLYVKRGTNLQAIMWGGSQESGQRSGSESLPLIVGMAKALEIVKKFREDDVKKYRELHTNFMHSVGSLNGWLENGHPKDRLYNVASLCISGVNGENLVAYLDVAGFEVATGAACEASNDKPSAVLIAIGRSEREAQGSLRISFGRTTTHKDIDSFVEGLKKVTGTLL